MRPWALACLKVVSPLVSATYVTRMRHVVLAVAQNLV